MPPKGTAFTLIICATIIAAIQLWTFGAAHAWLADYRAFWCAGKVLAHGGNPYLTAPLVACEYAAPWFHPYGATHVAIPAPLPGYALLPFAALSFLPFSVSAVLWLLASLAALLFSVVTLARLTSNTRTLCAAFLVLPAFVLWLPYGEIVPFALAGSLLVAEGLREQRRIAVVCGLTFLAVEPHLAAGVWIAVALFARGVRVMLAAVATALAGIWLLLAKADPVTYFREVLPLHALSQLPADSQFSVTWIAQALGFANSAALAIGSASYVCFTAAAIIIGLVLVKRTGDAALLPLFVIAGEVTGGSFIHESQIAAALPATLWFAPAATMLLAIPWLQLPREPLLIPFAACIAGLVAAYRGRPREAAVIFGFCTLLALVLLAGVLQHANFTPRAFPSQSLLASADDGRYIWSHFANAGVATWLRKLPAWAALGIIWFGAVRSVLGSHASSSRRSPTSTSVASNAPTPSSTTVAAP